MSIGSKIKGLREKEGLSQKQLADELNISRPSITKYERDEREPSYGVLIKISDFFGVSFDYLLGKTDEIDKHIYNYDKNIKRLENIYSLDFVLDGFDLNASQKSAVKGLLSQYLSLIEPNNPIALDCIYLSNTIIEAIEKHYYYVFETLYETLDNVNFYKKDMDTQTLVNLQHARKALNDFFNNVVDKVEKLTLVDMTDDTLGIFFIDEISKKHTIKKGKGFIAEREAIYELFKSSKKKTKTIPN